MTQEQATNDTGKVQTVVLKGEEFDTGMSGSATSKTVPADVLKYIDNQELRMNRMGFDIGSMELDSTLVSGKGAFGLFRQEHNAAAMLFMQWSYFRRNGEIENSLAAVRLFNRVTRAARTINEREKIVDLSHVQLLEQAVRRDIVEGVSALDAGKEVEHTELMETLRTVARERTHEVAWPWVVLPTFKMQSYGRIVLAQVDIKEIGTSAFIVQPTFNDNQITLFHTHGQNWAFSSPLGEGDGENRHINVVMRPKSNAELFPLQAQRSDYYYSGDVIVIKPKTIHGISGARGRNYAIPMDELERMSADERDSVIKAVKFGSTSSLHVYVPDITLARQFQTRPAGSFNSELHDMVMLNQRLRRAEVGGGGAWEQRCMSTMGRTGEHCGVCYAEKAERAVIPDNLVLKRFFESRRDPIIISRPSAVKATVS